MSRFVMGVNSEFLKFCFSKTTKVVVALTIFLQGALAYIASKQILAIGLNATPETNKNLYEAIPAIEFLGFDVIIFGLLPMIVLGAVYGASEYKSHSIRTTLLSNNKRSSVFLTKLFFIIIASWLISLVSIAMTISITHFSLGNVGLKPLILTPLVWKYILFGTVSWTGLTVLAFVISFLFKTAVVPLLFLIPQIYNVGNFLAQRFSVAKLLPVSVGNSLIASSDKALTDNPIGSIFILFAWILFFGLIAFIRFYKSDLGGEY